MILNRYGTNISFDFPGTIVSLYIDIFGVTFVESKINSTTYLNIFNNNGDQFANISYNGLILSYG